MYRCLLLWVYASLCLLGGGVCGQDAAEGGGFRIATYNVRNYLSMDRLVDGVFRRDYPKPESEKAVVRESILAARPDLLVLQEVGSSEYLRELRDDLAGEGLLYERAFVLEAEDDTRRIGALWKEGLKVEPVAHTDLSFRLFGEEHRVKRGMLELRLDLEGGANFSVFALHLKSKYTTDKRDFQAARQRTREAEAARDRILELYPDPANSGFLIVGDLNDYRNSSAVRRFLVRGETSISEIVDLEDDAGLIWTHFYQKGGEYSLIDYMLASPGLKAGFEMDGGILSRGDYYAGSDHRLVWADIEPLMN